MLVIQLEQLGSATQDPVYDWLVGGQFDGQDIVGGVSSGGEDSPASTGLVEWADIGSSLMDVLLLGCREEKRETTYLISDLIPSLGSTTHISLEAGNKVEMNVHACPNLNIASSV